MDSTTDLVFDEMEDIMTSTRAMEPLVTDLITMNRLITDRPIFILTTRRSFIRKTGFRLIGTSACFMVFSISFWAILCRLSSISSSQIFNFWYDASLHFNLILCRDRSNAMIFLIPLFFPTAQLDSTSTGDWKYEWINCQNNHSLIIYRDTRSIMKHIPVTMYNYEGI